MFKQKPIVFMVVGASLMFLAAPQALATDPTDASSASSANTAADASKNSDETKDASKDTSSKFPYQKTFLVSAYYSPQPGQKRYATGSFAGDVRLNGEGVHSADGTVVFPGMVAAPKTYPFGTKIQLPGIGMVGVHDRGGAIVNSGQRGQSYDRLDVWMGYGDEGLYRALRWGKRRVVGTVYGIDASIKENVILESFAQAEKYVENTLTPNREQPAEVKSSEIKVETVNTNKPQPAATSEEKSVKITAPKINSHLPQNELGRDDRGEEVVKLQKALQKMGYQVEPTGVYDNATINAIFQFQKDHSIVDSEDDIGAGYFGKRTLAILSQNYGLGVAKAAESSVQNGSTDTIQPITVFPKNLALGDSGDDVRLLQAELKNMNLLGIDPTGYYGEVTAHAVFKFQQIQKLVGTSENAGAGQFGDFTRSKLHAILQERERFKKMKTQKNPDLQPDLLAIK